MIDTSSLALFLAATVVVLLTPGPAVFYIVARSIDQGSKAGLVSMLGIGAGSLVHVTAAAFGLSALLMSSALAFSTVKYLGAAYLIYLGIRTLTSRESDDAVALLKREKPWRIFSRGIIVQVLNPKATLFFLAFLPQFVDPARGSIATQALLLGLIFVSLSLCTDSAYALLAGSFGRMMKENLRVIKARRYFAGTVYITLGIAAALSGSGKKQ